MLASHLIEHVPHRLDGFDEDGFFVFMGEIHRVLRSGGTVRVVTPHWENARRCFGDPTHTRVVTPEAWEFFDDEHQYAFYSETRFDLESVEVLNWDAEWGPAMGSSGLPMGMHVVLRMPWLGPLLGHPRDVEYVLRKP